ncbi:MAG: alpha/beta hydrolase [Desulfobacter sp.]|nr:alpha/beta hydrolase [Desulfobacter sp.]WDP87307.1 MAG: alpha/beta hydrolase [Desulfobacter sp.]
MSKFEGYESLDLPGVTAYLFHPRRQDGKRRADQNRQDMMIPVEKDVALGASLHLGDPDKPVLLFFHGNGEIVSDYDDIGNAFFQAGGVNLFVVDYRGYGESTGRPSVSAMMEDGPKVLNFLKTMMKQKKMSGPISVMGRSLGSAPAICLAADFFFHALIVESGFAFTEPLLRVLGLDPEAIGFKEGQSMGNLDKIKKVKSPCLIIHAQFDRLIPFSDGKALHDACPAIKKHLLEIKGADHNNIFAWGMIPYLDQVRQFSSGNF